MRSFVGPNNSLTNEEFDALVKETEALSISGLKTFVQSKKDQLEDKISSAKHFVMVKHPPNPQFIPCLSDVKKSISAKHVHFKNVLPPTIHFKNLSSQQPSNPTKGPFTSYRKRMKLSRQDFNKLSGVKDEEDEYSEEMYANYMKLHKCFSDK